MAGPAGSFDRQVTFALTLDRDRRPIELGVSATGMLAAGATLPIGIARRLGVRADAARMTLQGRRWELVARLDLRDPGVASAWAAFRRDPADPGAIRGLATALRTRAHLDVRSYAVSSKSDGAGCRRRRRAAARRRARSARSIAHGSWRPQRDRQEALWEQRSDCVAA